MDLYLRKVIHPQAHENYRVILKLDEGEFVIGSIGAEHGRARSWGINKIEELASGVRNAASRFRSLGRAHHPPATRSARSASRPTASSACAPAMERFDGSRENGSESEPKFVIEGPVRFQGLFGLIAITAAPAFLLFLLIPAPLVPPVLSILSFVIACVVAMYALFIKANREARGSTIWNIAYLFTFIWIVAGMTSDPKQVLDWFDNLSMVP
jgi:hypothetical protein